MAERRGRVLGVDVGHVRVGLAISDPDRLMATPLDTAPGGPDLPARLRRRAEEEHCTALVIGLPLALSGRDTDSTRAAREVARALEEDGMEVHLWDERLSSAEADRSLRSSGRRRDQRKQARDRIAATIILQGWLDAHRA